MTNSPRRRPARWVAILSTVVILAVAARLGIAASGLSVLPAITALETVAAALVLSALLIFGIFYWFRVRAARVVNFVTKAHPHELVFAAAAHPTGDNVLAGRGAVGGRAVQVVAVSGPLDLTIFAMSGASIATFSRHQTRLALGETTTAAGTFSGIEVIVDGSTVLQLFPQSLRNRWILVRMVGDERSALESSLKLA